MKKLSLPGKTTKQEQYLAKREFINKYKLDHGCERCGFNDHPAALQLDHIDPSTKFRNGNGNLVHPSQMTNYSLQVIRVELAKCRVLCANCHMIYTHTEQRILKDTWGS